MNAYIDAGKLPSLLLPFFVRSKVGRAARPGARAPGRPMRKAASRRRCCVQHATRASRRPRAAKRSRPGIRSAAPAMRCRGRGARYAACWIARSGVPRDDEALHARRFPRTRMPVQRGAFASRCARNPRDGASPPGQGRMALRATQRIARRWHRHLAANGGQRRRVCRAVANLTRRDKTT
jgi:hypothetical protein